MRQDIKIIGVDVIDFSEDISKRGGEPIKIDKIEDICRLGHSSFDAITWIHVLEQMDIPYM